MPRHDARQLRAARSERAMAMYADRRDAEAHAGAAHSLFIVRPTAIAISKSRLYSRFGANTVL